MIVLEGMDNTGKTTLAKRLAESTPGLQYAHSCGPRDLEGLVDFVEEGLKRAEVGELWLYDRFPLISEEVYGPVLRGESRLPRWWWLLNWRRFMAIQPRLIYCRPRRWRITKTMGERSQMDGVADQQRALIAEYDWFFRRCELRRDSFERYRWDRDGGSRG